MSNVELTPVRQQHRFDEAALAKYMREHVPGADADRITVQQYEGGQSNPTFMVAAGDQRYVVRKQPPGELLPSAHQVDREFRVMHALEHTDVPVPVMYALCEDPNVIGTKFYVMQWIDGRVYTETLLPGMTIAERREVYLDMARVMAKLHAVVPAAVGLDDFGRPGNYYGRQINRWSKQYVATETETIEAMDNLITWLPDNIPNEGPPVIAHGDFRLGNMVIHPTEPRVAAVLDWELSTIGDGLADLAYWCQEYHRDEELPDTVGGCPDIAALGIPSEDEIVAQYCKTAGRPGVDNWPFYIIYNLFRMAGIVQGVYKRGLDGNASSAKALEYAGRPRRYAERGWQLVQEHF